MNKLTAEVARMDIGHLKSFQANPHVGLSLKEEKYLQALEIALPVLEHQGGWIRCGERMPPSRTGVLVGCWFGKEWAMKWATRIHGHPDANEEGWLIPGASWVPTHWHELPAPPQPQPSTTPQIDNDVWIEWSGGKCPVDGNANVELKFRDGCLGGRIRKAGGYYWGHSKTSYDSDIIAYRVIENDERV